MEDISKIGNNITNNYQNYKSAMPKIWTRDSLDLNMTPVDEFIDECKIDTYPVINAPLNLVSQKENKTPQKTDSDLSAKTDNAKSNSEKPASKENTPKKDSTKSWNLNDLDLCDEDGKHFILSTLAVDESGNILEKGIDSDKPGKIDSSQILKTVPYKNATIGTFNIEWLGGDQHKRADEDYKQIAQVIKDSGASLLGIEEISTTKGLTKVLENLPDWGYIVSRHEQQRAGLIFDKRRVKFDANSAKTLDAVANRELLEAGGMRPPLSVNMQIDGFDCNFVVVHQKANPYLKPEATLEETDQYEKKLIKAEDTRYKQGEILGGWIEKQMKKNPDKDLIIMGDFNDFAGSESLKKIEEAGIEFVEPPAGSFSHIRMGTVIDHIGVSGVEGGAIEKVIPDSATTVDHTKYDEYEKKVSDHVPLLIKLNTAKEEPKVATE